MLKIGLISMLLLATLFVVAHATEPVAGRINNYPERLPVAVSNHAVASMQVGGEMRFFSFNGLKAGKTYQDITAKAHVWHSQQWHEMVVPEAQKPVLASTAVTVNNHVYLFGGYTVAADHSEKSVPNVWQINGQDLTWKALPPMPTPVDDAVALVYQNRYIYLISGWHDVDNVDLVQVLDTKELKWHSATPISIPPVFGHAGGIINNQMLVCDGVKVHKTATGKQFLPSPVCAMGTIDSSDVSKIQWRTVEHHSGTAFYRMAANSNKKDQYLFVAGSDNPYNYDGIGYNKVPAAPSPTIRIYNQKTQSWSTSAATIPATMDHRALLSTPQHWVIMGGMLAQQQVTDRIIYLTKETNEAD